MSKYYFFTEPSKLDTQIQGNSYGAVDADNFRVSSLFTSSAKESPKAIAITGGSVLVQQVSGPTNINLVNIILKPTSQPDIDLPPIDYIIYKGILKESLVNISNEQVEDRSKNDLTRKIWQAYEANATKFQSPMLAPKEPTGDAILGLGINGTTYETNDQKADTDTLDSIFHSANHSWFQIASGDYIGDFDESQFGIIIVVEKIGYQPTFALAREMESLLAVAPLPTSQVGPVTPIPTPAELLEYKNAKESVLSFIDPLAFFSRLASYKLYLESDKDTAIALGNFRSQIQNNHAGNSNKNNDSLNNNSNEIQVSIDEDDDLNTKDYNDDIAWPILNIKESEFDATITSNKLFERASVAEDTSSTLATGTDRCVTPIPVRKAINLNDGNNNNNLDFNSPVRGYTLIKRSYLYCLFPMLVMLIPFKGNNYTNLKTHKDIYPVGEMLLKNTQQSNSIGDYTLRDYTASLEIAVDNNIVEFITTPYAYHIAPDYRVIKEDRRVVSGVLNSGTKVYTRAELIGFSSGYILPMPSPYIASDYLQVNRIPAHKGIDMASPVAANTAGQPIYAVIGGTVNRILKSPDLLSQGGSDINGGGVRIRIYNEYTGLYYNYFHMQGGSNNHLNYGDVVHQGDQLGTVGRSGYGDLVNTDALTGPHLHFEIWDGIVNNIPSKINPYRAFPELALLPSTKHRDS